MRTESKQVNNIFSSIIVLNERFHYFFISKMYILEYCFDFSVPIGGGVPQQHHENLSRGSDKARIF